MADIEIKIDFECDGKKYHIDSLGLMNGCNIPLCKNYAAYKAGEVYCYPSKGKLFARIDDGTYNEIGQPTRLSPLVIPYAENIESEGVTIKNYSIRELYYDDDGRVVYDDSFHNQEYQAAPSKPIAEAKSPQDSIAEVCDSIKELLLEKNRKYGNSALNPCRVFSKADSVEQLKVRIDDKLNRIKNEQNDEDEDVVKDLIGYLVLLIIARGNGHAEEEI